ncbi:cytochrome c oxidase subunit VB-domain-containing protein, partial [Jimgerdemannia flammicorona]
AGTPAHSHDANSLIGPGGKPGSVPTNLEQATGLERLELLAKLEGKEFFDMAPLEMTHLGTKQNPIVVQSHDHYRYVGCTGKALDWELAIAILVLCKKLMEKTVGHTNHFHSLTPFPSTPGYPAESHDTIWLTVTDDDIHRCPECGSVYKLDFVGVDEPDHHH